MSDEKKFVTLDCFGAAASQSPSPPPWRVDESNLEWWILRGADGHTIMAIGYRDGGQPPRRADAALIAAAPEMLEVLRQAAAEVLPHEYGDLAEKAQAILDRLRGAGAIT